MVFWNYIILGIVQGVFEWIPVSSEGIVALLSQSLSMGTNPVDTALFLHLGTLLVVLVYFIKDWIKVLLLKDRPLLMFLIIATIVSLIIAFPLYFWVRNVAIGLILLVVTGCGLLITAFFHKYKIAMNIASYKLAVISGCLQGLSVIPGLSRSGITIFALSLGKSLPQEILKVSFMMSAPVVLASTIFIFWQNPSIVYDAWIGCIASFITGLLCLHFLVKLFSRISYFVFTLLFAVICFIGAAIGFITGM